MRASLALWFALTPAVALAYPQYITRGFAQCSACHYSPTGGGLPNAMGQSFQAALFGDLIRIPPLERVRAAISRPPMTGYTSDDRPTFEVGFGLDSRLLFTSGAVQVGGQQKPIVIPMLVEAAGVASFGPVFVYASAGLRRRSTETSRYSAISREHWLQLQLNDEASVRAGRVVLPFGRRFPDHTLYTREDFGFGKYDQSYALELDYSGDLWELQAAIFAGDLWLDAPGLQERGGVVTVARSFFDEHLSLGLSLLGGATMAGWRPAAALFLSANLVAGIYVVGELDGQVKRSFSGESQASAAGMLRVGWFPHDSTDIYAEISGRVMQPSTLLTKLRYQFGMNTHLLPWIELSPAVVLEEDVETGLKVSAMGQLHLVY